ncbi:MAG: hypothetical protein WAO91_08705 [Candidatus Nitrosotenuis sp.]
MKSLLAGEKILATFPAASKFGACTVYLTNLGLAVENNRSGLVLTLEHGEILSYLPIDKHSTRLVWSENQSLSELIIRCNKPDITCSMYRQIKQDHIDLLKRMGVTSDATTEKITIKNPLVESRFAKIPSAVADHEIWNDCWFDRKKSIYITHNTFFKSWPELKTRPHQIKYQLESGDGGVAILGEKVVFKFGLPAIKLPADKGGVWFLLPTVGKGESWKIDAARFAKDPKQRIDFTVQ